MIVLTLFVLPALLYGVQWLIIWRAYRARFPFESAVEPRALMLFEVPAMILHGLSLAWPWQAGVVFLGFAKVVSATLFVGVLVLAFEARRGSFQIMRLLVLPPTMLGVLLPLAFPGTNVAGLARQPLFVPHMVVGTLAYGVLGLAALHAWLMQSLDRDLHRPAAPRTGWLAPWVRQLPPLMHLERMLFRLIGLGFTLLLLTTLSGLVFSEEIFGRALRFEHKTVLGMVALGFFGILLVGRSVWGWRGRIATRLTLGGFAVLLLAYVGTRFVFEVLLHR